MGDAARDTFFLTSPQGSQYNLASYLRVDDGPDFGDSWAAAHYAENPAADGGELSFESRGVRMIKFPLQIPSGPSGIAYMESALRLAAQPGGAYLDIQLTNVPDAETVRFDVFTGRLKPEHNVRHHQQAALRRSTLELDVKPLGYWPTQIILASVASVGLPGQLAIDTAKLLGDVPGLGILRVTPTNGATTFADGGSWYPDLIGWSLSSPSTTFESFIPAASLVGQVLGTGTVASIGYAPGGKSNQQIDALEDGWRIGWTRAYTGGARVTGRFHAFAWARLTPSQALPWYMSADLSGFQTEHALASAAPVATLAPAVASGAPGAYGAQPSRAFTLLDLGEVVAPPTPEVSDWTLRLWAAAPTTNVGVATPIVECAGAFLLPLGNAGLMPRGLAWPTIANPVIRSGLRVDAPTGFAILVTSGDSVIDNAREYRGNLPRVGASTLALSLLGGGRKAASGATTPLVHNAPLYAPVSLTYRPRFAFVKGL